jgi:hypothetical protein
MRHIQGVLALARHAWVVCRAGQLRLRLETFGLYYPALPYTAPWWRIPPRIAAVLVRQSIPYARWIVHMDRMRRSGISGSWDGRSVSPEWLRVIEE